MGLSLKELDLSNWIHSLGCLCVLILSRTAQLTVQPKLL